MSHRPAQGHRGTPALGLGLMSALLSVALLGPSMVTADPLQPELSAILAQGFRIKRRAYG